MNASVPIFAETTPNPDTIKFRVDRLFFALGSVVYHDGESARVSPVAAGLFAIPGVKSILIGRDFVSVTKSYEVTWPDLVERCVTAITEVLKKEADPAGPPPAAESFTADEHPDAARIREILDQEIRPAVAMDGGDVLFQDYKDGILTLHLQGSCSSCPSSVLTLKMGIEARLKSLIPGLREVVQV
jgi:NFU1 iron-sulfur cluster scaffold homolog, mitochondrial